MKETIFAEGRITGILKRVESGLAVSELCCEYGTSDDGFYNWN